MNSTESKLRRLAARIGGRQEEDSGAITLVGDDQHTWPSTGTLDLLVGGGEFQSREGAFKALLADAELGRVPVAAPLLSTSAHVKPGVRS